MSPEVAERLAALALEHGLVGRQVSQLDRLLAAVARSEHASTTVKNPRDAVDVHVADSLSALVLPTVRDAESVVDIGSGAGFPGLPLAVALPRAKIVLVESVARRCETINSLAVAAQIENASVAARRVEDWPSEAAYFDVACARAMAPLDVVCEYAAPLLRLGGALVAWRGARNPSEEAAGRRAAAKLGLGGGKAVRTVPYPGCNDHHLHVYLKVRETPQTFPRRPGIARKRPLGRST